MTAAARAAARSRIMGLPVHNHTAADIYRQLAEFLKMNPTGYASIETDVRAPEPDLRAVRRAFRPW